jgi:hypothetical protein
MNTDLVTQQPTATKLNTIKRLCRWPAKAKQFTPKLPTARSGSVQRSFGTMGMAMGALAFAVFSLGCKEVKPVAAPPEFGSLDKVNNTEISGWVWNSKMPDQAFDVAIYDGDRLLDHMTANILREDLLSAKVGTGRYAFRFATPSGLNDGKIHQLRAKVVGTDFELKNSPKTYQSE